MRLSSLVFLCFFVVACGTAPDLGIQGESGSNVTEVEAVSADTPSSDEWEVGDDDADDGEMEASNPDSMSSSRGPILVLGDSVMAWNVEEGTSVGHVIEERTGQSVTIRAVSGAHFASDDDEDIRSQYVEGDWGWVVLDGGGNDLNDRCECGDCRSVLDELLSSDGTEGAVVDTMDALLETGTRVIFLTYYDLPPTAQFGFAQCGDESQALAARASAMARSRDGVYWVDMGQVVKPSDLSAYDEDHVHPSAEGSALIGGLVADVISAQ